MSTAWTARYALRTKGITSSAIRELLEDHPETRNDLLCRRAARARCVSRPSVLRKPATRCLQSRRLRPCSMERPRATSRCAN